MIETKVGSFEPESRLLIDGELAGRRRVRVRHRVGGTCFADPVLHTVSFTNNC